MVRLIESTEYLEKAVNKILKKQQISSNQMVWTKLDEMRLILTKMDHKRPNRIKSVETGSNKMW